MRTDLNADHIPDLSRGAVRLAINHALTVVLADIDDRGDDLKSRKLTLTLDISRVGEDNPDLVVAFDVKHTIPPMHAGSTICYMTKDARNKVSAQFMPDSPDRHDQPSLPFPPPHPEAE